MAEHPLVDFGFTKTRFPAGSHVCQICTDDEERLSSLLAFLASGLRAGECTACFSDNVSDAAIEAHCAGKGVSSAEAIGRGAFTHRSTDEAYFEGGSFDPARMLALLTTFHSQAQAAGFQCTRVIGEMSPRIRSVPGGSRLLEYESRVSILLRDHPITAVCQYDARVFDGATIMDVLKVHPMMVVRGQVVHNPFFVPPEQFLSS
jgi:MEDS: MEthanogen/methylotroph, DcmR Sensory domain